MRLENRDLRIEIRKTRNMVSCRLWVVHEKLSLTERTRNDADIVDLTLPDKFTVGDVPLREVITKRRSRRKFAKKPLTLEELSFLLWSTQGVKEVFDNKVTLRTVPSAGARHPFETYLAIHDVEGIKPGLYRYLALEHKLLFLKEVDELPRKLIEASLGQRFVGECAVTFIWTVIPYRTEWRYAQASHKVIAIDIGHVCQNLYLAAEAIGAGTCAVAAYDQSKMDSLIGVDGEEEFVIYMAPVGKLE